MDKIAAQVRNAEVRGAMAAFVDAGLVKVASRESFDQLCSVVADNLGDQYDLQKVAAVTEAVLTGGQEKTAAEKHDMAVKAALGDLMMMKTAGQIDDRTFTKEAGELMKMASRPADIAEMKLLEDRGLSRAEQADLIAKQMAVPSPVEAGRAPAQGGLGGNYAHIPEGKEVERMSNLQRQLENAKIKGGRAASAAIDHVSKHKIGYGAGAGTLAAAGLAKLLYDRYNAA